MNTLHNLRERLSPFELLHTPHALDDRMLEACLGGRRELADSVSGELAQKLAGGRGAHVVIDGAAGAGKSHLLEALIRRQVPSDEEDRPLVARAGSAGVRRLLDLALRWVSDLATGPSDPQMVGRRLALARLPPGAATQAALGVVGEAAGEGPLLLVVEGLDEILNHVGWEAWERFERVLARRPRWALLVTARAPSPRRGREWVEVPDSRTRVAHLDALSPAQMETLAGELLAAVGEPEPVARAAAACARAFEALVGGSPRSWIAFVGALRRDPQQPERAFLVALDRLMRDLDGGPLSPQQRLLVEELALAQGPLPVKELANACYVSHQTATAQLALLRASGVVRAQRRGRRALYELSDPGLESVIRLERRDTESLVESFVFLRLLGAGPQAGNEVLQLFEQGPELWRVGLESLFDEGASTPGARRALGVRLAATLPSLLRGEPSPESTRLWRDLWWEWGGRFPELRPALGALAGAQRLVERGQAELPLLPRSERSALRAAIERQEGPG